MRKSFPKGIYLITHADSTFIVEEVVEQAAKAGIAAVQLRDKIIDDAGYVALGNRLSEILAPLNIPLILNDRIHLYSRIKAQGVHVGQGDSKVAHARELIGDEPFLGLSIGFLSELEKTDFSKVDMVGIGPVFQTNTKKNHRAPIGIDGFKSINTHLPVPGFAIGGVEKKHIIDIKKSGASGIALISAICKAEDPGQEAQDIVNLWRQE